ncbi:MAG: hypothetical protein ISS19_04185 [Bacteroidales bacterium]|nr:hypothetical protein [Bacteroidales bacterium]
MTTLRFTGLMLAILLIITGCQTRKTDEPSVIFYSYAENSVQLENVIPLVKSLHEFGGKYRNATIWLYLPQELMDTDSTLVRQLNGLNVLSKSIEIPEQAAWYFLSGKVIAAARAEADAEGLSGILVFLNHDTVILGEPGEFSLPAGKNFGYRPVMHKNVGLLYSEPLDSFWMQIYQVSGIDENTLFPMVTPADLDTIRPYFNAGLLVVRPEEGILRNWEKYFNQLSHDPLIRSMCEMDFKKRLFLHQTALTAAVLNHLNPDELFLFSDRINYPVFFKEMFGAKNEFIDITEAITIRHESYFRNPDPEWHNKLKGPQDRIEWMKEHLIMK